MKIHLKSKFMVDVKIQAVSIMIADSAQENIIYVLKESERIMIFGKIINHSLKG